MFLLMEHLFPSKGDILMQRRKFLQGTLAGTAVVAGMSLLPQTVLAEWPKSAFEAKSADDALKALLGASDVAESAEISIKAPEIAENGAVVPVQVETSLAQVESITLLVEKNPVPLIASFELGEDAMGFVSTRIKMGQTSPVTAVVKAGGKLYKASQEVKVTIGGCGG
jgi:sulfur-oxidizing protein SoxY